MLGWIGAIGPLLSGIGSVAGAISTGFSSLEALQVAKNNYALAAGQLKKENERLDKQDKNMQDNLDLIGSVFDNDDKNSVWNKQ